MGEITTRTSEHYTIEGNVIRCADILDEQFNPGDKYELFIMVRSGPVIIDMSATDYVDVGWVRFFVLLSMEGDVIFRGVNESIRKLIDSLGWTQYCRFK